MRGLTVTAVLAASTVASAAWAQSGTVTASTAAAIQVVSPSSEPAGAPPPPKKVEAPPAVASKAAAAAPSAQAAPIVEEKSRYSISGFAQYRNTAVVDETPANDSHVIYRAELGYKLTKPVQLFVRAGVLQKFVQTSEVWPVGLQDSQVGFRYNHTLRPKEWGVDLGPVELQHQLSLFVPTSQISIIREMYAAPDVTSRAITELTEGVQLSLLLGAQYRFMRYAERGGLNGGMNVRMVLTGGLGLEGEVLEDESWGRLSLGADVRTDSVMKYPSREDFESPASDRTHWRQDFGWGAYVTWEPLDFLAASISVEQNGAVLREGIVNVFFTKLEETELVFTLAARY